MRSKLKYYSIFIMISYLSFLFINCSEFKSPGTSSENNNYDSDDSEVTKILESVPELIICQPDVDPFLYKTEVGIDTT